MVVIQIFPLIVWSKVMGNPDGCWSLNVHYISALYPETTRNTLYLFIIYLSKEEHYQCLSKRTLERVKRFGLMLGNFEEGFGKQGFAVLWMWSGSREKSMCIPNLICGEAIAEIDKEECHSLWPG